MRVSRPHHARLVGKGGKGVKGYYQTYGVHVLFPYSNGDASAPGTDDDPADASQEIVLLVGQASDAVENVRSLIAQSIQEWVRQPSAAPHHPLPSSG